MADYRSSNPFYEENSDIESDMESKRSSDQVSPSNSDSLPYKNPFDEETETSAPLIPLESPSKSSIPAKPPKPRPLSAEVNWKDVYPERRSMKLIQGSQSINNNQSMLINSSKENDLDNVPPPKPQKKNQQLRTNLSDESKNSEVTKSKNPIFLKAKRLSMEEFTARRKEQAINHALHFQSNLNLQPPVKPEKKKKGLREPDANISLCESSTVQDHDETILSNRDSFPRVHPPPVPSIYVPDSDLNNGQSNRYSANRYLPIHYDHVNSSASSTVEARNSMIESFNSMLPSLRSSVINDVQTEDLTISEGNSSRDNIVTDEEKARNRLTVDLRNENSVVRFLLKGRVYGYPGTRGLMVLNYISFVFNNHPGISIFCAHSSHPFSRAKRVIVFFCSLCSAFALTYSFTLAYNFNEVAACRQGCNVQTVTQTNGSTLQVCSGGANDGLAYSDYKTQCQYYNSQAVEVTAGLFTAIYTALLKFLATCGCVHGRDFFKENIVGVHIFVLADMFGGGMLFTFIIVSVALLVATILQCYFTGVGFRIFMTTIIAKLWSMGFWFVLTAPYFLYRYPIDKKAFEEKMRRKTISERESVAV